MILGVVLEIGTPISIEGSIDLDLREHVTTGAREWFASGGKYCTKLVTRSAADDHDQDVGGYLDDADRCKDQADSSEALAPA